MQMTGTAVIRRNPPFRRGGLRGLGAYDKKVWGLVAIRLFAEGG